MWMRLPLPLASTFFNRRGQPPYAGSLEILSDFVRFDDHRSGDICRARPTACKTACKLHSFLHCMRSASTLHAHMQKRLQGRGECQSYASREHRNPSRSSTGAPLRSPSWCLLRNMPGWIAGDAEPLHSDNPHRLLGRDRHLDFRGSHVLHMLDESCRCCLPSLELGLQIVHTLFGHIHHP
jgi:hypothetical protein